MKKLSLLLSLMLLLLPCRVFAQEESFDAFLSAALPGWAQEETCECGPWGAALLTRGSERTLVLAKKDPAWRLTVNNPGAPDTGTDSLSHISFDTEDLFILGLMIPYGPVIEQHYRLKGEDWLLESVIEYQRDVVGKKEEEAVSERHTALTEKDGLPCLARSLFLTDSEGNVLISRELPSLPFVLDEDFLLLAQISNQTPPFTGSGYPTDECGDTPDEILSSLYARLIRNGESAFSSCAYRDGILDENGLVFLAARPDGALVLLCGQNDHGVWSFTESSPLPENAGIGDENFTDFLRLPQCSVKIGRCAGQWAVTQILSSDGFFCLGPCWFSEGDALWISQPLFGTHPWGDITAIDWSSVPASQEEAGGIMECGAWATPNNPHLLDRLHLRAEPSRESASLGKYYNGTPVFVLEHGEEWTRVRVGGTEGYMMTQFLLFGQEAALSDSRAWPLYPVNPATPVVWEDGTREMLFPEEVHRLPVIGMTADEAFYLVWDYDGTGRMGRIPADALWEGNG